MLKGNRRLPLFLKLFLGYLDLFNVQNSIFIKTLSLLNCNFQQQNFKVIYENMLNLRTYFQSHLLKHEYKIWQQIILTFLLPMSISDKWPTLSINKHAKSNNETLLSLIIKPVWLVFQLSSTKSENKKWSLIMRNGLSKKCTKSAENNLGCWMQ